MEFNPARLTLARERRGYTKRAFAALVGCTERTVGDWERGVTPPPIERVSAIARVTGFPSRFFLLPDPEELPKDVVSFRALRRMKAADMGKALAAARMAFDLNAYLERSFNLPVLDIPEWDHFEGKPEAAADALRRRWGLGDTRIKSMVTLLEHKGVRVFSLAEDTHEMDAFAFWRSETPFVFLNTRKSAERSRFDAAHELGHLLLHRHGGPRGRVAESEANAFASAFLMPRSSVALHAPRDIALPNLVKAKHTWGVSVAALAYRMHKVGMMSEWRYHTLRIELEDAGYRTAEPEEGAREKSQVYEKVFRALREDGIGKKELAEELCWPVEELNALVFGLILSVSTGGSATPAAKHALEPSANDRPRLSLVK